MLSSIERAFYVYITAQPAIVAVIGTRLYPNAAPQSAIFPYVIYHRTSVDTMYFHLGPTATLTSTLQIECFGYEQSASAIKHLASLFRTALDGYVGVWDDVEIDGVFLLDESDHVFFAEDGSDRIIQSVILLIDCWHERGTNLFLA